MSSLYRILLLAVLAIAPVARAHYLWWEVKPAGQPALRFGEFENDLREKSPGRLDTITGAAAFALSREGGTAPLPLERKTSSLAPAESSTLPATALVAHELTMEVKDWCAYGLGIVKPMFYARFEPKWPTAGQSAASLALDIVPLTDGRVRVLLRGAPIPKVKLLVHAPNGWSKELEEFSADGTTTAPILTPWPGLYVLEVIHLETAPGEFGGKPYEAIRHRATLAIRIP